MITVFLGGTCNNSTWRDELVEKLDLTKVNPYNPVVADWTEEAFLKEEHVKDTDDVTLFVITPEMTGLYSIAEAVHDSTSGNKMMFCVIEEANGKSFSNFQLKSLKKISSLIKSNGGIICKDLDDVAEKLNNFEKGK